MKKEDIVRMLEAEEISYKLIEHRAIYTVAEGEALNRPGGEFTAKNLFICDDKREQYLLLCLKKEKRADLKGLRARLGTRRLTLASEEDLQKILGLFKGAVTPFGAFNDAQNRVSILIDSDFKGGQIGVHPNVNTATLWLLADDLFRLIQRHGNKVEWFVF